MCLWKQAEAEIPVSKFLLINFIFLPLGERKKKRTKITLESTQGLYKSSFVHFELELDLHSSYCKNPLNSDYCISTIPLTDHF